MAAAFTMLLSKLAAIVEWFGKLAVAVFQAAWDFIRDAACWPFEQVMEIVVSAVQAVDLAPVTSSLQSWGTLPGEILNMLGLLGVGQAAAIIVAAIGIRLVLQLIPFTRLGS
ncbi:hypothetical protein CKY39_27290 [Variovorax boronicumulans]|uniref:DUF2523 domain-containing protein n=1 Tax=Variovorax boronicumulans TaxID=436515 RepID=A0A250DQ78_9BURK|nr:DUF2523 family protein [Variovorax boronicumulans]ATA56526.1 hypothetical protein CKY39_27290 [Variovorax boronicumulans]